MSGGLHGPSFWSDARSSGNFGLKMLNKMGWQHGKGLGKQESGVKEFIRSKQKLNQSGIGAVSLTADQTFQEATDLYNEMLKRLNRAVAEAPSDSSNPPDLSKAAESSEANNYSAMNEFLSRRRLYSKFRAAKNISCYSDTQKAEIFAVKKNKSEREEKQEENNKTKENSESAMLKSSNLSLSEYFSQKQKAPGFTEDFQSLYYSRVAGQANKKKFSGLGFENKHEQQEEQLQTNINIQQDKPNPQEQEKLRKAEKKAKKAEKRKRENENTEKNDNNENETENEKKKKEKKEKKKQKK